MLVKSDAEFLNRIDKTWTALFSLAALLLSPMVSRLIFDYDTQVLAQFCLLLLCVVVPFVVQIWGIISESVRKRFVSWVMLLTAILVIVLVSSLRA